MLSLHLPCSHVKLELTLMQHHKRLTYGYLVAWSMVNDSPLTAGAWGPAEEQTKAVSERTLTGL